MNVQDTQIAESAKTIFTWCRARTSNLHDAQDLSQDILLELCRSVKNLREPGAFYGFMWSVADNVYRQWLKKQKKGETCTLDEAVLASEQDFDCDEEDDLYLLRRELSLLAERYRRAMILYYIERRSCAQIASLLDLSESMVKYLLFKGRQIVKEGMNMERKIGTLSYHPKKLNPRYSGEGPNHFAGFMDRIIPQNIVSACYNAALTEEQISLELGIPLPYLEDEIRALTEKKLLVCDKNRYLSNLIIIDRECAQQIAQAAAECHDRIAQSISAFITEQMEDYRALGFYGSEFSENTLRWQLATLVLRAIQVYQPEEQERPEPPVTGWGEHAFLWLKEVEESEPYTFNYSGMSNSDGSCTILFYDYLPAQKGDHHDLWGNQWYIDLLCDVASKNGKLRSEYDLAAVEELVRKGYVISSGGDVHAALPVYTPEQYSTIDAKIAEFIEKTLAPDLTAIDESAQSVIAEHTPEYLKEQIPGIAVQNRFYHTVCAPARRMVAQGFLSTAYHPDEMPTTFVVQNG